MTRRGVGALIAAMFGCASDVVIATRAADAGSSDARPYPMAEGGTTVDGSMRDGDVPDGPERDARAPEPDANGPDANGPDVGVRSCAPSDCAWPPAGDCGTRTLRCARGDGDTCDWVYDGCRVRCDACETSPADPAPTLCSDGEHLIGETGRCVVADEERCVAEELACDVEVDD